MLMARAPGRAPAFFGFSLSSGHSALRSGLHGGWMPAASGSGRAAALQSQTGSFSSVGLVGPPGVAGSAVDGWG